MTIPIFQVDAFAKRAFEGNPAAVCPLADWLPDVELQAIAAENNLSETAYFVGQGARIPLRWFTPRLEVNLCGHATLAAAHVLLTHCGLKRQSIVFETLSGPLTVRTDSDALVLDLPAIPTKPVDHTAVDWAALGPVRPEDVHFVRTANGADHFLMAYRTREQIAALRPDFPRMTFNAIATAPGETGSGLDFMSRYFAPMAGVNEDPVTGSAHCALTPFWVSRLGRQPLSARQISARGGTFLVRLETGRVYLTGHCVTYMQGSIAISGR